MFSERSINSKSGRSSVLRDGLGRTGFQPVCLIYLMLLAIPALAQAPGKGHGVEVRAISAPLQQVQPGQIISLSFRVFQSTPPAQGATEEFIETLELPEGWQSLLPSSSFTLGPAEATTRLALLRVPVTSAAGSHEVAYVVRSQRDYGIQDTATITVDVAGVSKLALLAESAPDMVIGGASCVITARAINGGNASLPVTVAVTGNEGDTFTIEPAQFDLPAGANRLITVTVKTAKTQERPEQRMVQIAASSTDAAGEPISGRLTVPLKVIARLTTAPDLKHRLPATLSFRFSGEGSVSGEGSHGGFQAEFAGRGTLDDRGSRRLDFLFRGPDTQDTGIFGLRDEYRLSYESPTFDARLGDQSYGLSPLTSYYRYGRGLGVELHPEDAGTAAGVYFLQSRWGDDTREIGLHAQHRVNSSLGLKLNFLHSSADSSAAVPDSAPLAASVLARDISGGDLSSSADLVSLEGSYSPKNNLRVDFEYARGSYSPAEGARVSDSAYRIEARGSAGNSVYYSLQKTHAGPDYYGYYHDADYTAGSVSFPISSRLKASLSFNDWRQNLELRPYQEIAPRERLISAGLSYALPNSWQAELGFDHFRREDALAPMEFDYTERPLRLAVSHSTQNHSLRLETIRSKRADRLSGREQTAQEYRLSAYYRPSEACTFSLYGALSSADAFTDAFLIGSNDNLGMSFDWRPQERLSAGASYLKYGFGASSGAERAQGNTQWEVYGRYLLADQRALNLRIRNIENRLDSSGTSWMLSYAIPLGLPVGEKTTLGIVRGRIFDYDAITHAGRGEVILSCGNATAITDAQGQFIFPALPVGAHTLDIDRGSLGVDIVTREKLPLTVSVTGGQTTTVEIATTRAGSILGAVKLVAAKAEGDEPGKYVVGAAPSADADTAQGSGIANLLVEASSGEELLRTMSNARGEFAFKGLRPGSWSVKVYNEGLPEQHYLEQAEQSVELAAGQTEQIGFTILPRLRRIKLIDSGTLGSP